MLANRQGSLDELEKESPGAGRAVMDRIVLENVSKFYGPQRGRALRRLQEGVLNSVLAESGVTVGVREVSLTVRAGETFILMGLSGSGKSTLLRLLNRLIEPSAGRILVNGTDINCLGRKDLVMFRRKTFGGMVFQQFAILPHRTVLGNVEFGLEVQGVPRQRRRQRALEIIERVGLGSCEKRYPQTLSGGMQQRVGLARALAVEADILLMDEPFSALDPMIRRELQDELLALQGQLGKTIVFVTHDLSEALRLGDRIAIMKGGRVVQLGTAEAIVTQPADAYVAAFVRDVDPMEVLMACHIMERVFDVAAAEDRGVDVLGKMRRRGLESLFVTDAQGKVCGLVRVESLRTLTHGQVLKSLSQLEPPLTVHRHDLLLDVVEVASRRSAPVAVTDDEGCLVGVIGRSAILRALAGRAGASRAPSSQLEGAAAR